MKPIAEWYLQAEYDIETAEVMLRSGRYIYAIFMAHLAIEKALKGVYSKVLQKFPPRTHNLILLLQRIEELQNLDLSGRQRATIEFLNEKSIPSRYPDTLSNILKEFDKNETNKVIEISRGILECLKNC